MSSELFKTDSYQISLNGTNVVSGTDNAIYRYTFPSPILFQKAKVAVTTVNIFYSWFNISEALENNTYQFTFTDNTSTTTYTVTMPDGYYSVDDLDTYLQNYCITNGLYLVNASGDNVYYVQIQENATYYAVQLNNYAFPTALPSGWTNPNSLTFPATASTTQFIIPATNFQNVIGFTAGTYPSSIQTTTQTALSDYTPQVTPIQSVVLACNLIDNRYSNPPSLLYPFSTGGVAFGGLIESAPNTLLYVDVNEGYYNSIDIEFLDQDYKRVKLNDTNLIVQLAFLVDKEHDPRETRPNRVLNGH